MADYNVDTLEDKIIVEANSAISSLDKLVGNVKELKKSINEIKSANGIKSINDESKKAKKNITELGQIWGTFKQALNISGLIYGIKKLYDITSSANKNSIAYIETLNLFEVSMGKTVDQYGNLDVVSSKYYTKALDFQNRLHNAFGTNMEETMRYQALYNQMAESMGIGDNASYIISENLTKLGIDLASLFNKDESDTMEALRSGVLAGQTKPLRNYGMDVTQATLQTYANDLGLDRSVSQLSQAEKMILRYIAVLKQSSAAHGDFAKTLESPANQIKVFKQQLEELKTSIGNLFQGLLGQILPYVNGVIMAIKEVINAIGVLFGFELKSNSKNLVDQSGIDDLNDGLSTAVGSAKALKNELFSWDEIHNIDDGSSSSGGGSVGLGTSAIDSKLLDALGEYDNLMGNVQSKAKDIRDKILEWLGFVKEINPLTGEISWELGDGLTNFEKILEVVKTIGIAIGTWKISSTITTLMNNLGILKGSQAFTMAFGVTLSITGIYLAYKGTEHLLNGDIDAFSLLETCLGMGAGTLGLVNLLNSTKYGQLFYLGEKIKMGLGVMLGIQGFQVFADGVDKDDITKQIGGLLESAFGGYLIGSQIGGWKLGIAVSLIVSVINVSAVFLSEEFENLKEIADSMWEDINKILEGSDEIPQYIKNLKAQKDEIQRNTDAALSQIEYAKALGTELESLMDSNGKIYAGYESRAEFILNQLNEACGTEYSLTGNQITINGKLVKSYDDIKNSINDIIEAKKNQILLEANEEAYANALKNRMGLYQQVEKAEKNLQDALIAMYEEGIDPNSEMAKSAIQTLENNLILAKQAYEDNTRDIIYYEDLQAAIIEGDSKKISDAISNMSSIYETEQGKVSASLADRIKDAQLFSEDTKKIFDELGKDIDEQTQARLDASVITLAESLAEQTRTVESLTPDQKEAWKVLAKGNYDIYKQQLDTLEPDTQKIIQGVTGVIVEELDNAIPDVEEASSNIYDAITKDANGSFSINFDAKVNFTDLKTKLTSAKSLIDRMANIPVVGKMFTNYSSNIQSLLNQLSGYAEGGFPPMGEIFMANEAGPELVGRIGSRTAVANNNQIVEAVSRGVYEAVTAAMPNGSTTVQLDVRADEGIIVRKAAQGFKDYVTQTGELPFPVPV